MCTYVSMFFSWQNHTKCSCPLNQYRLNTNLYSVKCRVYCKISSAKFWSNFAVYNAKLLTSNIRNPKSEPEHVCCHLCIDMCGCQDVEISLFIQMVIVIFSDETDIHCQFQNYISVLILAGFQWLAISIAYQQNNSNTQNMIIEITA